jgi:hypothetical protein
MTDLNYFVFRNEPVKTAFAPEYQYFIANGTINNIDFRQIADLILREEVRLIEESELASPDSYYTGLNAYSLTSRALTYNVFDFQDEEIQKLKHEIFKYYCQLLKETNVKREQVLIQCWANVLRQGEEIKPHMHAVHCWSYLSGHVTVQCENTRTVYINPINQINEPEIYAKENKVGELTIFQSSIPHYTTQHTAETERITIAFDILPAASPLVEHRKHLVMFDDLKEQVELEKTS